MPADEIDYRLIGDDLQGVIVTLDPDEAVVAEAGAMMYMQDGIRMMTTTDMSGQGTSSLMNRLLSAGKRVLAGDSFFVTIFVNEAPGRREVAFASPYPGKIKAIDLDDWGGTLIAQKDAFLCGARGVDVSIAFAKRIGAECGEGFLDQQGLAAARTANEIDRENSSVAQASAIPAGDVVIEFEHRFDDLNIHTHVPIRVRRRAWEQPRPRLQSRADGIHSSRGG
jgi:hypothetical protein